MLYLELLETGVRHKESPGGNRPSSNKFAWVGIMFVNTARDAVEVYASGLLLT